MPLPACTLVIFGATGDLARHKLLPALAALPLHEGTRIIATGRRHYTDKQYCKEMRIGKIVKQVTYHTLEFGDARAYASLRQRLGSNVIFYFAAPPSQFPLIARMLHEHGMTDAKLIFEKPFGTSLASAVSLNKELSKYFAERNIYRIDHYLGKEFVQNIMVLRFTNALFSSIWDRRHIDNVQIIVGEQDGVGTRGAYYDGAGCLRDMVQNHLLQLLALTAMEEPSSLDAQSISARKARLLKAVRFSGGHDLVLGQYTAGVSAGKRLPAYRKEKGVDPASRTETYAAVKLTIDNTRWHGVPFYLSSGKALKHGYAQVVVQFKEMPCSLFCGVDGKLAANTLVIRIQPDEGVELQFNLKETNACCTVPLIMEYARDAEFGMNTPSAYERLLSDVMHGDRALFTSWPEVEQQWRITDLVGKAKSMPYGYRAGSHGPAAARAFLMRDGRQWFGDKPVHGLRAR